MIYSVKMRASKNINGKKVHISGAERMVEEKILGEVITYLKNRAMSHEKGKPDFINIKIEEIDENEILELNALNVSEIKVKSVMEGFVFIKSFLESQNIKNADYILNLLKNTSNMRGAIILEVNSLERLEPDLESGVRVTYMDYKKIKNFKEYKIHFNEALVLATKVVNTPGIVGELCISDDPNYTIGYVATKKHGYIRVSKLKEIGSQNGARIFLYDKNKADLKETLEFLRNKKVLVVG